MALFYADEIRQSLRQMKQDLKGLANQRADKQKEQMQQTRLLNTISTIGQRGAAQIDPAEKGRIIAQLDREIRRLNIEIGKQEKRCDNLQEKLSKAPKRPKARSQVASIAASGSRAINDKAKQFDQQSAWTTWKRGGGRETPEEVLLAVGMAAARKTAKDRYGVDVIPPESEQIMKGTLDKILLKRRSLPHPPTKRSSAL
jgi:septal ring factor EnvC (AmiA/AmiB activator)